MAPVKWSALLADQFHEHPLPPASVELAIKDLFPGTEVEFPIGDRDHDFATHDLTLEMRVGVVFAGPVVMVLAGGFVGSKLLEPDFVIVVQTGLVIVDEDRGADGYDFYGPVVRPCS
jgi:hypothetical protein